MDEAKLRQIIDEARFTGASGEEKTMDMMRIYERKLRKGGNGGILTESEASSKKFSYNRNRTAVFNMSSCPNGYHVLFVCRECKIMVRNDAVSCPRCHKVRFIKKCGSKSCSANKKPGEGDDQSSSSLPSGCCPHKTRVIDREQPHAFFYSAVAQATDVYMHMEDDLVNINRQDLLGSIRYDKENDCFSGDSSLNSVAIATRLGEREIQQEAVEGYANMPPPDERCFLDPDYDRSFDKEMKAVCM